MPGQLTACDMRCLLIGGMALIVSVCIAGDASFSPEMLAKVEHQFGVAAKNRILDWQQEIYRDRGNNDSNAIQSVNAFFNRVPSITDQQHWGQADYWTTPMEFLASNGGDCEDYTIAKYFTLRELGVPDERLRITYVSAARSPYLDTPEAHMVLAYYPQQDAVPLILDSLTSDILPASRLNKLEPVFSFNGQGLCVSKGKGLASSV